MSHAQIIRNMRALIASTPSAAQLAREAAMDDLEIAAWNNGAASPEAPDQESDFSLSASNAQTLEDLRYCADNFTSHKTEVENNLREFAAHLIGSGISPPAQKPASVLGGSGAGLVGTLQLFDAFALVYAEVIRLQDHIAALPVKTCQDHADLTDLVTTSQVLLEMANIVSAELPPAPAPEPCLFPQPKLVKHVVYAGTGTVDVCLWRHDFDYLAHEHGLDAGDVPSGGVRSCCFVNEVARVSTLWRA